MKNKVLLFLTATVIVAESYIVTDNKIRSRLDQDEERLRMTPLGSLEDRIRIEAPEPARRMVRTGDNVTLTCEASHPWFLCLWVHPGDGKLCSIKEDGSAHAQTVCQGVEGAELVTDRGAHTCSVHLTRVGEEEAGQWMCLLSQAGVFHTDRVITELSVASPASLELRADKEIVRIQDNMEEDIMELVEDETLSLECGAVGGHPEPRLHWALAGAETGRTEGGLEEITVTSVESLDNVHTSGISYAARLRDSGRRLVCVSEQMDPWTGEMMYNTTASVRLVVRARASPLQALLTEQQDVVAGVVISCCLIIFCVVIIIIFTVRSSKAVNSPKRSLAKSKHRESYIIFLEEEPSTEACETMETKEISKTRPDDKESGAESGIDVSHGDFVSFSSSDMYSSKAASEERAVSDQDTSHQSSSAAEMISDDSHHHDVTLSPHDTSSDGCAASEGGLSNLSVFDCQHGCFHEDSHHHYHHQSYHQPEHHYIKGDVLNTDL